tara:strand:+ start:287 stop:388 length:102 start_codon:yes stop_codon:yes gene_type:complete
MAYKKKKGAAGKACWAGYRRAGPKKCVKIKKRK